MPGCMCGLTCESTREHVSECMCMHMWGPEIDIRCPLKLLFTIHAEAGPFTFEPKGSGQNTLASHSLYLDKFCGCVNCHLLGYNTSLMRA